MLRRRKPEPVYVVLQKEPKRRPIVPYLLIAVVVVVLVFMVYSQTH